MKPKFLRRLRLRAQRSETVVPVALAVAIGLLSGAGAVLLRSMIGWARWLFFDQGDRWLGLVRIPLLEQSHLLLAPALGMVIVSWMVRKWAPEAEGHGVPEVQYAIRMLGGRIRHRVAVVKAVASALSIGSGGSVGREGPIVQIGSSLGSSLAQIVGFGPDRIRLMVAAGSAGAIAATFNAPIAGVMFAMEVILGSFAARSFGLVVIASVSATAVSQAVLGQEPAFRLIEQFTLRSDWEFPLYLVLGLFTGLVALVYIRAVYFFEDFFHGWRASPLFKAAVGGLAVGALGTFGSHYLFGVGHEGVELALRGEMTIAFMLALVAMKILATSITLGAGGSGGVFAPALFIGAMAGGAFGKWANLLLPDLTAHPGAYALVGAAALFGAAAHAPITGIIILFEMTNNYRIILPLMFSVVVAYLMASRLQADSIYSVKLRRKGGMARARAEASILDILLVTDAMSLDFETVTPDLSLDELAERARAGRVRSWPVVDEEGELVGIVSQSDLEEAIIEGRAEGARVGDIMSTSVVTCTPGESLRMAFQRFAERDVFQIPVVEDRGSRRLTGVLRRNELLWAYKELADEHQRLLERTAPGVRAAAESVQIEMEVEPDRPGLSFRRIRDLRLPRDTLVVLLRRGDRTLVPRGDTVVEPGDVLVLLTTPEQEEAVKAWIGGV